jgi:membrane dipeptidase
VLDRRQLLLGAAATAGAVVLPGRRALAAAPSAAEVKALYARAHVIDMLAGVGAGEDGAFNAAELKVVAGSGVTAINVTVGGSGENWDDAIGAIAWHTRQVGLHPRSFLLARQQRDLEEARRSHRLAFILGTQGSLLLGRSLDRLEVLHALGVRIFQLTYNRGDLVGDGCLEPRDAGLTRFGRDVMARLDELRVAIDLSHCGPRVTRDAIAASKRPVLITHSGCSAVFAHPRNKDDATLKAMADKGGALGIYLMPFLGRPADGGPSTAAMALDHIEHALKVCGEDHVGIGTDGGVEPTEDTPESRKAMADYVAQRKREGVSAPEEERPLFVPELNTPRRYEMIAQGLAKRGHSLRVIEKVLGAAFYKALGAIWG